MQDHRPEVQEGSPRRGALGRRDHLLARQAEQLCRPKVQREADCRRRRRCRLACIQHPVDHQAGNRPGQRQPGSWRYQPGPALRSTSGPREGHLQPAGRRAAMSQCRHVLRRLLAR
eukprot:8058851-Pyramimonas_sp.AAC.1